MHCTLTFSLCTNPVEFLMLMQVTKTICTETEEIVDNEVCAYSFTLVPVETEAKLVDVKWEKSCTDDTICINPHHAPGGYAAPTHCVEEYRHICYLSPVLYPVIKKVTTPPSQLNQI